eukprot:3028183-Lingulodinium_polyedra.AAC.1
MLCPRVASSVPSIASVCGCRRGCGRAGFSWVPRTSAARATGGILSRAVIYELGGALSCRS